jgi:hypothetical protein
MRNLFHFFKPNQYEKFFQLIKNVLRPGGIVAMTVNSGQHSLSAEELMKSSCFYNEKLYLNGINLRNIFFQNITKCDDPNADPLSFDSNVVCEFKGNLCKTSNEVLKKVSKEGVNQLITFLNINKSNYPYLSLGEAEIINLKNISMMFSPQSLETILEKNGFKVANVSDIDISGHAFQSHTPHGENYKTRKESYFIGAIATFSDN